ncbi:MAG: response regulator [Deltaproteobacteria bacterium]|jgi:two-component system, LuxR family, sensor kinase FixL|nr:response regulator [Deltaproteobacteria bacterium]MBT7484291.1 response regulator [Candidatus Peregrinibacteria bacterium]MBT4267669.1 response regulator [Deltaproteobacteria bacterium]MBT4637220.1 response regulator [Deltaproteobacteria bacterium]MBT6499640.1 response regulator [Deltaproteobacteria bacterium]
MAVTISPQDTQTPPDPSVISTILVVDDTLNNLFVFQQLIEHSFKTHRVLMTTDPLEGIKMASDNHPDVILLDFQMPMINGIEVCKRLKADESVMNIPIILITGNFITPLLKAEGLDAGASDFIVKPIDIAELTAKIKVVLRSKQLEDDLKTTNRLLHQEIAKRKETEANLLQSEQKFRELVEGTDDLVTQVDKKARFKYLNHMSEAILGIPPEECTGQSYFDFIHPDDLRMSKAIYRKWLIEKCSSASFETRMVNKTTGKVGHLICTLNFKYDDAGDLIHINSIARDITSMKKAEREIVLARNKAESANVALQDFLSFISHEIRNPIHHIIAYANIGVQKTDRKSKAEIKEFFEAIKESSNVLLDLLNDFLDLSKSEAGKMDYQMKKGNLKKIIDNSIKECQSNAQEKGIIMEIERPVMPTDFVGDIQKIKQVMRNLLANAIKFTPSGKKISVSINLAELSVGRRKTDDQSIPGFGVVVKDEGIGIPEDELESIFSKFAQSSKTKNKNGGTGLGLAICFEIIKAHQGRIWAENNPEGGAIFSFLLPYEQVLVKQPEE